MKKINKIIVILLGLLMLTSISIFATTEKKEFDISKYLKDNKDEAIEIFKNEELTKDINFILTTLEISEIKEIKGIKEIINEITTEPETTEESQETETEVETEQTKNFLYKFELKTDKYPLNIEIKDNKVQNVTAKVTFNYNSSDISKEIIFYDGTKFLEFESYYSLIEKELKIDELNKNLEKSNDFKMFFYIALATSILFLLTTIIFLFKMNSNLDNYRIQLSENDKLIEEINIANTNIDNLNKKVQKFSKETNLKQEQIENQNVYIDKLSKCIAKLNKELQEEKSISAATLKNFETMHENDLKSIGNAHQEEIAKLNKENDSRISDIRNEYELKIKELEDNNKGLQKALSNIANNK